MRGKPNVQLRALLVGLLAFLMAGSSLLAAESVGNRPERVEWFGDLGFGLFIHWSMDVQLGLVIAHSVTGASDDYTRKYFEELPRTFNPKKFDADDWAILAKLAGFKYVVFTAKHHNGFCMYDSDLTDFSITNTPYGKDLTAEIVRAFRAQGIAIGFYFSPDDFYFLYKQGKVIGRRRPGVIPQENPPLMEFDNAQIRELLTKYGPIDIFFIDGDATGLREQSWETDPNVVVTRGALETPEQYTPGVPLGGVWEGNLTMGTSWHYKPTNESYKSGTELIETLIQTRAKGGNLLLNIGPKPNGEIPIEQEALMRELGLWNFGNEESIVGVRPWVVTNEGNIWFTKKRNEDTVYAFITGEPLPYGEWKTFSVKSVRASEETTVEVLGQSGKALEYSPDVVPQPKWTQDAEGLHITAMRAQRMYNNRRWPNPIVLKITHAQPGLTRPVFAVGGATWDPKSGKATLRATLESLGDAKSVEVGFQVRRQKGTLELYEPDPDWKDTALERRTSSGEFSQSTGNLKKGLTYEYRLVVKHPLLTFYSGNQTFTASE